MEAITLRLKSALQESIALRAYMLADEAFLSAIATMAEEAVDIYRNGGKLLIAGNGGSAADAQHFAAEITCQYKLERKGRAALALHTDTSALTAWGNDKSFNTFFARQVEAHGRAGDGLVVISTSGNSENLLYAAEKARTRGIKVFGLLGRDGGKLYSLHLCDKEIIIPSNDTPRIQECHIMVIHMICEELDQFFLEEDRSK